MIVRDRDDPTLADDLYVSEGRRRVRVFEYEGVVMLQVMDGSTYERSLSFDKFYEAINAIVRPEELP